jgi:hypothetical protein
MAELAIISADGTITTILENIQEWNLDKPFARTWFESNVTEAVQRHLRPGIAGAPAARGE